MGTYSIAYVAEQYQVSPQRVYAARHALGMGKTHHGRVAMSAEEYHQVSIFLKANAEQRVVPLPPHKGIVSCCGWTALRENNPDWRCPECGGRGRN